MEVPVFLCVSRLITPVPFPPPPTSTSYAVYSEPVWINPTKTYTPEHWRVMAFRFIFAFAYMLLCFLVSHLVVVAMMVANVDSATLWSEPGAVSRGGAQSKYLDVMGIMARGGQELKRYVEQMATVVSGAGW